MTRVKTQAGVLHASCVLTFFSMFVFRFALKTFWCCCRHEAELHELFSRLDTDGGGTVDFNEFARFTARHFQPLSVEEECDLIIALIQGGGSGDETAPVRLE